MKIRKDFVTNSSSSSFVISTTEAIPEQYIKVIEPLTIENALDVIKARTSYPYTSVVYSMEDEDLQKLGNFSDEQMMYLKLAACGALETYLELVKKIKNADKPLYHIFVDRDWLYYQDELDAFIHRAETIDEEGDL